MSKIRGSAALSTVGTIRLTGAIALVGLLLASAGGCAANRAVSTEAVTIEGVATARGNEPFSAYMLEDEDGRLYILEIPESMREDFRTPSRLTVTGRLYQDDWNGSPFAHIEVTEWDHLD